MKKEAKITYPYARLKGMGEFMSFVQSPGWRPGTIDAGTLRKLDISKGKERLCLNALVFLGILTPEGTPTAEFDNLKKDYEGTLRSVVLRKYDDLFKLIPPPLINQSRLVKFFGLSADTSEYQAKLFAWLCEQAGIELPNVGKRFHRARFDKRAVKQTAAT
jgi:hypothetical protein